MHSPISLFLIFFLLVLFFNPKSMSLLLLSSSSETKLFELHSLPRGNLTFLGDSRLQYNEIALTTEGLPTNASGSAGVVLYRHPILFRDPRSRKVPSFYTTFAFSIQNVEGVQKAYGDGLAFLISPSDNLLGKPGYFGLIDSNDLHRNKFIAIEFDTKRDSMFHDPDDNHVGLDINNLFSIKLATASSLGVDLKSGNLISSWIDYKSNEKRLEVFISKSYLKPEKPLLNVDIDLSNYLNENMFVGFSAATGGGVQLTHIQQWEFTIMELSPPPPPSPPESGSITFPKPSQSEHRHSHLSKFAIGLAVGVCSVTFLVLFGWFCWEKLMAIIWKSEGTNNLEMQTTMSSRGISGQEILLSILLDEVTRRLKIEKVSNNETECVSVKTVKSGMPLCNSLPAVKPKTLPPFNGLLLRTDDVT